MIALSSSTRNNISIHSEIMFEKRWTFSSNTLIDKSKNVIITPLIQRRPLQTKKITSIRVGILQYSVKKKPSKMTDKYAALLKNLSLYYEATFSHMKTSKLEKCHRNDKCCQLLTRKVYQRPQ